MESVDRLNLDFVSGEDDGRITFTNVDADADPTEDDLLFQFQDVTLTPEVLRSIACEDDLERVEHVEIQINTEGQSLDGIGIHCPNLRSLNLNNSYIASFRDLGCLNRVRKLWLGTCGLTDLDGIEYLTDLTELYASDNHIADVSALSMHESLTVVDLHSNKIKDIDTVEFLESLPKLVSLRLDDNPLCALKHYRNIVCSRLPLLCVLDGLEVNDDDRLEKSQQEESLVDEAAKREADDRAATTSNTHSFSYAGLLASERPSSDGGGVMRPRTAVGSRPTSARAGSAPRMFSDSPNSSSHAPYLHRPIEAGARPPTPSTLEGRPSRLLSANRPGSAFARPSTAMTPRPGTSAGLREAEVEAESEKKVTEAVHNSSELTIGHDAICGNFIASLRARKHGTPFTPRSDSRDRSSRADSRDRPDSQEEDRSDRKERRRGISPKKSHRPPSLPPPEDDGGGRARVRARGRA